MKELIFIGNIALALCLNQCQSDNHRSDSAPVVSATTNTSIVPNVAPDTFIKKNENEIILPDTGKKQNQEEKKTEKKLQDAGSRLIVSFISKGGGIDSKTKKSFEKMIVDFNSANKCNVSYTVKPWGREGERDYCFASGQGAFFEKFVAEVNEHLKGMELVQLKENAECRK